MTGLRPGGLGQIEMADGLERQSELEELSAWMDGELDTPAAERVARLVREDPRWRATFEQFRAVDASLAASPPASPAGDLADRITAAAYRRRVWARAARIAAPAAAAAAIVLAVYLGRPRPLSPVEEEVTQILSDVASEDRFIVQNLTLFEDYEDVERYEQVRDLADADTLAALASLEAGEL